MKKIIYLRKLKSNMKKTIFLVEDEKPLVESLVDFLSSKGYVAEAAFSGSEALKKLPVVKPNLILLDIVMPEMSGIDFLKEVQKMGIEYAKIPVIVLTNLQGDASNFEKLGLKVEDYFVKANTSLEALHRKIKEVI